MEILGVDNKPMSVNGKLVKATQGTSTGDMKKSVYDPTGTVEAAGGIPNYVEANGGKIDTIKVNGTAQAIADKTVDIAVPTKTSDLTNDSGYLTSAPVTSVNGKTGEVKIVKADVGLSQVDNVKQYSAKNPPPYPVTSVNGKTGAVTVREVPSVTASDNGKFLRVVNGVWVAATIDNANGVSF